MRNNSRFNNSCNKYRVGMRPSSSCSNRWVKSRVRRARRRRRPIPLLRKALSSNRTSQR